MILSAISNYSVVIWVAAAITASFGFVVYFGGSTRSSRAFLATVISMAVWTASVGAFIASTDAAIAAVLVKIAYFSGTMVAASFFFFFLVYPHDHKPPAVLAYIVSTTVIVLGYIFFYTDLIIGQAVYVGGIIRYEWQFGPYWPLFYLVFYTLFLTGPILRTRTILTTHDLRIKHNLAYMIVSVMVVITPPTFMNIILPQFGYFDLIWLGPIVSLGWVSVIAYSIVRFRQLDIRTFTTEILNIALVIIFFANIFSSFSGGILGRTITFIAFLVISYFIIRMGARVDDLNRNLKSKVAEQTREIQGLYEIEKKARVELEHLNEAKDQFIMVTQHHLRTPLTQIKWYLQSLGDTIPGVSKNSELAGALGAAERLNHLLNNFLDIAQLQVGKGILEFSTASLLPIVKEAVSELSDEIARMGLKLTYPKDAEAWPEIEMDQLKMKEVVFIIIQNAVKYNEKDGNITIDSWVEGDSFKIVVANTGIGVEKEDLAKLSTNIFTRSESATKVNPLGMGMGLTFARYIVEAHKGSLELVSEGLGKGARVSVVVPVRHV